MKIQLLTLYTGNVGDEISVAMNSIDQVYLVDKIENWTISSSSGIDGYSILTLKKK